MIHLIEQTIETIDSLIKEQLPESKYQFELFDLVTNTKHFRGYNEPFHWGSVYKLFVVAEIIKMSEEGHFKMDDEIELHKDLYKHGNGIIKSMSYINKLTYMDACKMVMAVSDNLCADELFQVVGLERLNQLFQKAGCVNSKLSVNLDTMVKELFEGLPKNTDSSYFQSNEYFDHLKKSLKKLLQQNFTRVEDINNGFYYLTNTYFSLEQKQLLFELLLTPNLHTRIAAYTYFNKFLLRGKTGALGFGTFNSETAAIIDKSDYSIKGYFTIATNENKQRNFQSNDTIGLIGLEITKLYEQLIK